MWSPTILVAHCVVLEFYMSQHCVVVRHVIVHALPRVKMCGILECQDFHIILRFPLRANMATSEEWRGGVVTVCHSAFTSSHLHLYNNLIQFSTSLFGIKMHLAISPVAHLSPYKAKLSGRVLKVQSNREKCC